MTEITDRLSLPYIMASQAQKHVTHNEAVRMLDALCQISVTSRTVSDPPASPLPGQAFLVPASGGTGEFEQHGGALAVWQDGAFAFFTPQLGWSAYVEDEDEVIVHAGNEWHAVGISGGGQIDQLGINSPASPSQRLALASDSSLFSHDAAGDHRISLNRETSADTASLIWQTGFSGGAELGLAGNDNFSLKTSDDDGNWHDALVISRPSATTRIVNPANDVDLLINGDFSINQRQFAGGALSNGSYGFDRWKAGSEGADINRNGTQVSLSSGSLTQHIEGGVPTGTLVLGVEGLTGDVLRVSVDNGQAVDLQPDAGAQFATFDQIASQNTQLEISAPSGAATFLRISATYGAGERLCARRSLLAEHQLCQRYFASSLDLETVQADGAGGPGYHMGVCYAGGNVASQRIQLPGRMRVSPSLEFFAPNTGNPTAAGRWQLLGPGASYANADQMSIAENSELGFVVNAVLGAATAGNAYLLCGNWRASAEF